MSLESRIPTVRRSNKKRIDISNLLVCGAVLLVTASSATAQAPVPTPKKIEHVIPLRIVQPLPCTTNSSYVPCVSLDKLQAAVERGNTFWSIAGIRFWIKSVEYHNMPLLRHKYPEDGNGNLIHYSWDQVRNEIRSVFPHIPEDAYDLSETKQAGHWMVAATAFYGDPTEVLVFMNTTGGSSANFPWRGRMIWLATYNVWNSGLSLAATTLPHELGHFLGLLHLWDSPGNLFVNPSTGLPYSKCDYFDQLYTPGNPPQFFSSPTSPGCSTAQRRIAQHALVKVSSPTALATATLDGITYTAGDTAIQAIAAPTGLIHNPPAQWGYSLNLMGGFTWDPSSAAVDGHVPRHLVASQVNMVDDFLNYDHAYIQENVDLYVMDQGPAPKGALAGGLTSLRSHLGKADDDFIWWSNGAYTGEFSFAKETKNIGPGYLPVSGDFDGDGYGDLVWYRPATGAVTYWWSNGDGTFDTAYNFQYNAHARLFSGDFDGNGMDDLYFYVPGGTQDVIAYGTGNRQFYQTFKNVHATWEPFSGDFDGDSDDDIVWFDALADDAVIWWSDAQNNPPSAVGTDFTTDANITVGGRGASHCHRPVVGNFDGAHGDDVMWYCAGTGAELIWKSNGTQSPTKLSASGSMPASVDGFYRPFSGDFDGDGFDDIFWDDSSPRDAIWAGGLYSPESPNIERTDLPGFFKAVSGDFDGDGDSDVFLYRDTSDRWMEGYGYNADAGGWQVDHHPRLLGDVDGDGRDDVVGFGAAGVWVSKSTGDSFSQPSLWISEFGADNWQVENHPRMLADVNNDGRADIVGFGNAGVYVARSTGNGFLAAQLWVSSYGYSAGNWRVDKHPRMMADVNGDGRDDVVGFANPGVYVSLSTGTGFTAPQSWLSQFGYNSGWRLDKHPRVMADVNGDGRADIVGFGDAGVLVSLSTGSSFTSHQTWVYAYGYNAGGWKIEKHPRFLADVDGDGKDDIVGFGNSGVWVSRSTGAGFYSPEFWEDSYGFNEGWTVGDHPRTVADVNGDGMADVVGFGGPGAFFSLSTGSAFTSARQWIDAYGKDPEAEGWKTERHLRTLGDVDGDGRADLVGFGNSGVQVWRADFCFAGDEL